MGCCTRLTIYNCTLCIWLIILKRGRIYVVEGSDTLAPSDAQKRASAKYQRENIASLACRVKKEQAEKFKSYCAEIGKTSNAVLRDYVLDCIGEKQEAGE